MTDKLNIVDFISSHAHHMVSNIMNHPMNIWDKKYLDQLDGLEVKTMSFTALKHNEIVCSGGIIPMWDGVFEGWVMASDLVWQNRIGSAKAIKKGMEQLIQDNKVVRLQTAIKKDFILGQRFGEWLGMKREGLMKKFQNNEDYYRYARIE